MNYSVCYVAYAGLQGQQVFRQSSVFYFILQEVNQVVAHSFCIVIQRSQCTGYIRHIAGNDGNDLGRIARNVRGTYTVACMENRNRFTEWRILTHVNISHANQVQRLGGVDFYNDFLCSVNIYRRVADSGCRIEFAVRSDLADFNYCKIRACYVFALHVGEEACTYLLSNMGQVQIVVVYFACVDSFSQVGIGLVRHTVSNAVYSYQFCINLGTGGSAGPDVDLEWSFFHAFCEFMHCNFRIAAGRKSGNTDDIASTEHFCCSLGIAYLGEKTFVFDSAKEFTIIGVDHYYHPPKNEK